MVVPALSAAGVAAVVVGQDASMGAVTDLTAHDGVAAERLGLALGALGQQGPGGADALPVHRLTQPGATVTGCGGAAPSGHSHRSSYLPTGEHLKPSAF